MAKTAARRISSGTASGAGGDGEVAPGERYRDFGTVRRASEMEPLFFDLCGKRFHCRPALQSKKMLSFVRKADGDSGAAAGEALHEFLETVILPEDVEAWREIIDGDEFIIQASTLGDIVTWLVEQYAERPTQR